MNDPCCNYQIVPVGGRWRIVPPGTPPAGDGRTDLIIARGAFGSGEHDTTASCLEALACLDIPAGGRVLDFGCGTGVLAIAALELGAGHALGIDVSSGAIECARRNAELNGVADRVELRCGELGCVEERDFDLVVANIYGDIILAAGAALVDKARPGGHLLLSGILWEDNFAVRRLLESRGCTVTANRMLEQHSTIAGRRLARP